MHPPSLLLIYSIHRRITRPYSWSLLFLILCTVASYFLHFLSFSLFLSFFLFLPLILLSVRFPPERLASFDDQTVMYAQKRTFAHEFVDLIGRDTRYRTPRNFCQREDMPNNQTIALGELGKFFSRFTDTIGFFLNLQWESWRIFHVPFFFLLFNKDIWTIGNTTIQQWMPWSRAGHCYVVQMPSWWRSSLIRSAQHVPWSQAWQTCAWCLALVLLPWRSLRPS